MNRGVSPSDQESHFISRTSLLSGILVRTLEVNLAYYGVIQASTASSCNRCRYLQTICSVLHNRECIFLVSYPRKKQQFLIVFFTFLSPAPYSHVKEDLWIVARRVEFMPLCHILESTFFGFGYVHMEYGVKTVKGRGRPIVLRK